LCPILHRVTTSQRSPPPPPHIPDYTSGTRRNRKRWPGGLWKTPDRTNQEEKFRHSLAAARIQSSTARRAREAAAALDSEGSTRVRIGEWGEVSLSLSSRFLNSLLERELAFHWQHRRVSIRFRVQLPCPVSGAVPASLYEVVRPLVGAGAAGRCAGRCSARRG
jgi:hypothetical protein